MLGAELPVMEGIGSMISESGPSRWESEDDTPTQTFGAIREPDNSAGWSAAFAEADQADLGREEHGLTALLEGSGRRITPERTRERRTVKLTAALGAAVLVVFGVAAYEVISGLGHEAKPAAARHRAPVVVSHKVSLSPSPTPPSSPTPTAVPTTAVPTTAAAQVTLRPASVTAVGPGGQAGDDSAGAGAVLGGSSTPWQTDWYATAEFGGLQTGTGLLLNLGSTKTVYSVTVSLGIAGVDFQLRAGQSGDVSSLGIVATENNAPGQVRITLAKPVQARYLLIWFTKLAPDGKGTYQAAVDRVTVRGS
jgi:hypothetical protein